MENNKLKVAYNTHKGCAKRRGIGFHFTYEEWLKVWTDSGKLAERGTGAGRYCMCRYGDQGDYEAGNVYIATTGDNLQESRVLMGTAVEESKLNPLGLHLLKKAGNIGRDSDRIKYIAEVSGLSVWTVQSLALGRRQFNRSNKAALRKALGNGFKFGD